MDPAPAPSPDPATPTVLSALLLEDKPVLAVDTDPTEAGATRGPLTAEADPLPWSLLAHGMRLLPGFLGVAMPEDGVDVVLRLRGNALVLATVTGHDVLAVPVDDLPAGYLDAVQTHGGALAFLGRGMGVHDADDARAAATALHAAAGAGRVVGGIVGLCVI
ncbi:MAG: hypothetical protein ACLGIR_05365 [Actinomycetes bacterium]